MTDKDRIAIGKMEYTSGRTTTAGPDATILDWGLLRVSETTIKEYRSKSYTINAVKVSLSMIPSDYHSLDLLSLHTRRD
jgi:hypothetical protein